MRPIHPGAHPRRSLSESMAQLPLLQSRSHARLQAAVLLVTRGDFVVWPFESSRAFRLLRLHQQNLRSPQRAPLLQYVWFVQDRLSHRLYWLHDWDCGLVVWVCTADHLEDEEASGGGQRHDTTTWAAYTAWLCYARTRVLGRYVNHHAARRDRV